jgi:hypothetical protein
MGWKNFIKVLKGFGVEVSQERSMICHLAQQGKSEPAEP